MYYIPDVGYEFHISFLQNLCARLLQTTEKSESPWCCSFREKPPHVLFSWRLACAGKCSEHLSCLGSIRFISWYNCH